MVNLPKSQRVLLGRFIFWFDFWRLLVPRCYSQHLNFFLNFWSLIFWVDFLVIDHLFLLGSKNIHWRCLFPRKACKNAPLLDSGFAWVMWHNTESILRVLFTYGNQGKCSPLQYCWHFCRRFCSLICQYKRALTKAGNTDCEKRLSTVDLLFKVAG